MSILKPTQPPNYSVPPAVSPRVKLAGSWNWLLALFLCRQWEYMELVLMNYTPPWHSA
jgi:hypothetical protein